MYTRKITNWRRATGVGHKDRRGVFVTEENKSQVLADLGILGSDENDNDRARKGEEVKKFQKNQQLFIY